MNEDLIFGIVGAVLIGLVGLWLFGNVTGIVGAVIGFVIGVNIPDWLKN